MSCCPGSTRPANPALAPAAGVAIWPVTHLVTGIPLFVHMTVGKQSLHVRDRSTAASDFLVTTLVALGVVLDVLLASSGAAALLVIAAILAFFVVLTAPLISAGRAARAGKRFRYLCTMRILR
jgi:hypothetical protein